MANSDPSTTASKRMTWDKLKDAPSHNLPFPKGNITAVEFLTYLPSSIKSWDVVERFISNGANTPILAYIINTMRIMPHGPITHNSLLRTMQNSVRLRKEKRYEGWTVLKHQRMPDWDERRQGLDVGVFRTQAQTYPRKHEKWNEQPTPMPFKSLAVGVRRPPAGHDALDLTRCVEYHMAHPDEEWYYPSHFEALVKHIGGPATVTDEHLDSRIFARWAESRKPGSTINNAILHQSVSYDPSDDVSGEDTDEEESDVDTKARPNVKPEWLATKDKPVDEKRGKYDFDVLKLPTAQKASVVWESESEMEEFRQSWVNWRKHGIAGLAIPIVKKEKRG